VTVRQALAVLEEEGFVRRKKGCGTFVGRRVENHLDLRSGLGTIAIVCSNEQVQHADEDVAFATILRAMEGRFGKTGYAVQIIGSGADPLADRRRLVQLAQNSDVRGVCTIGPCLDAHREVITDLPIVESCRFYPGNLPFVGNDVSEVCQTSVAYLLSRGHRRIAAICGQWIDAEAFACFARGYHAAFEASGLPCPRNLLCHAFLGESLRKLAAEVLAGPGRPTAVFAENWRVCRAVLTAADALGLRIPDDLSVLGYGQNILQMASSVAITAYVPDSRAIGEKAAELLIRIIRDGSAPKTPVALPGRLVERDSVRSVAPGPETPSRETRAD
jgi:DNA-binding LacI/PurR family transcriptional regulator